MFPVRFLLFKVCPKFYVRANGTLSIDYSIKQNLDFNSNQSKTVLFDFNSALWGGN